MKTRKKARRSVPIGPVRLDPATPEKLEQLYPNVPIAYQIDLAVGDLIKLKQGKFFDEGSIYATYQLADGNWQSEAIFDTVVDAIDNMIFHSQGRAWRVSNCSLTPACQTDGRPALSPPNRRRTGQEEREQGLDQRYQQRLRDMTPGLDWDQAWRLIIDYAWEHHQAVGKWIEEHPELIE